ncbi:MAG: four helix bundle protein [Akkermansiaceae bacterium]|nr:four helix bundle protein [Akkermansiaceae bacterium]
MEDSAKTTYDLEERLLDFGARIISLTQTLTENYAQRHIANQLLRSATAPLANHGEAQAAESPADFIHKLRLSLEELLETHRWLKLMGRAELISKPEKLTPLLNETDQPISIFVSSISTAEKHRNKK